MNNKKDNMLKKSKWNQNNNPKKWKKSLSQIPCSNKEKNNNTFKNKNKQIKEKDNYKKDKDSKQSKRKDNNNSKKKKENESGKIIKNNSNKSNNSCSKKLKPNNKILCESKKPDNKRWNKNKTKK